MNYRSIALGLCALQITSGIVPGVALANEVLARSAESPTTNTQTNTQTRGQTNKEENIPQSGTLMAQSATFQSTTGTTGTAEAPVVPTAATVPNPSNNSSSNSSNNSTNNSSVATTPPPQNNSSRPPLDILTPAANSVMNDGSVTVTVRYGLGMQVELSVNGRKIDANQIGRTETDTRNQLVTQTWYGVVLRDGENLIEVIDNAGKVARTAVQVRGEPKYIQLRTLETRIPADGRTTATIEGELIDIKGNRSNRSGSVTLSTTEGDLIGVDQNPDQPGFQVKVEQGRFVGTLRASTNSGNVTIRAVRDKLEGFTQIQFETNLRPSIATGVLEMRLGARGTDYYRSFRDFLPSDRNNSTQLDVYGAAFASGRIGEWLFTGAYNNIRSLNQDCSGKARIYRDVQFCDQNYSVYGDSSQISAVTPSYSSVYLRMERTSPVPQAGIDYAMWGDFNTQEFNSVAQQFTGMSRQFNGFKTNYNWGNLQLTGLYSSTTRGFQRDNLVPDGTSGYYFLTKRGLMPGSESLTVETAEVTRPGDIVQSTKLERGKDYDIDYERGTILFRQPFFQTEVSLTGQNLYRRIVVTYEYDSPDGAQNNVYGGQARYHFSRGSNRDTWLGLNYFQENQGIRNFKLYGLSSLVSMGTGADFIAEYARSENASDVMGTVTGTAFRSELKGPIASGIMGRLFLRSADTGFANNATISFIPGQTRFGGEVQAKLSPSTSIKAAYERERNQGTSPQPINFLGQATTSTSANVDNLLQTWTMGVVQQLGSSNLELDWLIRSREDYAATSNTSLTANSNQLRSRLTTPLQDNLQLILQNETSLSGIADNSFPDRSVMALDWRIFQGLNFRVGQQWFHSGELKGNAITSAELLGEYKLATDTTLTGRYSVLGSSNTSTTQGAVGLNHRWAVAPGWRLNLGYERVFGNFATNTGTGVQTLQPFSVGQSTGTQALQAGDNYNLGVEYTDNPDLKASARYEYRTSSGGANTVLSASVLGKINSQVTGLFRYQQAGTANQATPGLGPTTNLKLGLAFRDPNSDMFNGLLRYEFRVNPSTIPDTLLIGTGSGSQDHLFAMEGIYAPNWQWEFYGKLALRNSTTYIANDFTASSSIYLGQLRAIYRMSYNMDVVLETRGIGQPSAGYMETGFVGEIGYYLTPNLRLAAGYSSGSVNSDRDFSGSRSGAGPYAMVTFKLNELWDGFGLQKLTTPQPQDSTIRPNVATETTPAIAQMARRITPQMTPLQLAIANTSAGSGQPDLLEWIQRLPDAQTPKPATIANNGTNSIPQALLPNITVVSMAGAVAMYSTVGQ
ncbi:MAG: TonB-dependent receptor [Pseudanabaenaceae cyanobacterium]